MAESKRRKPKHIGPTQPKSFTVKPPQKTHSGVLMCWMSNGNTRHEFTSSMWATARVFPEIIDQRSRQMGPRVASGRNGLIREFLLTDAEWFLGIDTDQYWAPEDLRRLLDAADPVRRPIIGGLVFADQGGQLFPTMYKLGDEGSFHVALDYPRDSIVEVDGTGAAFIMIHRRVIERMATKYPEPFPWYQETVVNGVDRGEDLTFCTRARELGYKIFVHTGVKVGHVKTRYLTEAEYDKSNDAQHFLITGTGRSGTGYIRHLLSRCLIPTGHEDIFNPKNIAAGTTEWKEYRGESSWLAAPFIESLDVPTIQLVRNPIETLRSLVGIGFLARTNEGHQPYEDFVLETLGTTNLPPTDDRDEIIRRNVDFMYEWSAIIEAASPLRFRVEDLQDLDVVNDLLNHVLGKKVDRAKVHKAISEVATDENHRRRDEDVTWADGGERLAELAERWGYEVDA